MIVESEFNLEYSRLEWALGLGRGDKLGLDTGLLRSGPAVVSCTFSAEAVFPRLVAVPWLPRPVELMLLITSWLDINKFSTDLFLFTIEETMSKIKRTVLCFAVAFSHNVIVQTDHAICENCCSGCRTSDSTYMLDAECLCAVSVSKCITNHAALASTLSWPELSNIESFERGFPSEA